MKILTLHIGHDANVSTFDSDSGEFKYFKYERLLNAKHMYGTDIDYYDDNSKLKGFIPDIACLVSTFEIFKMLPKKDLALYGNDTMYYDYTNKMLNTFINDIIGCDIHIKKTYWIHHTYAHILSSWIMPLTTCPEYGVSIDGSSPDKTNKLIVQNPFSLKDLKIIFTEKHAKSSYGHAFAVIGKKMRLKGGSLDSAGKIMGLQSYGVNVPGIFPKIIDIKLGIVAEVNSRLKNIKSASVDNQTFLNFIASFHARWEDGILAYFTEFIPRDATISFAGGCAQNTVTNWKLYERYKNISFVPHCYDGGLSIGAMGLMMMIYDIPFPKVNNFPYIQEDEAPMEEPTAKTIQTVAKLLAEGKIVGWYQGHGECGPRALGNRSILMHPAILNGKDILNAKVKHREWWRPFAPSIMEEHAHEWFNIEKGTSSKYMMMAVPVHEDKSELISSVVHEDGSSRIQTVSETDNKIFYKLLNEFYKLTGIPLLLNTSFNPGRKPIMGKLHQPKEMLRDTELDVICVGNDILYK